MKEVASAIITFIKVVRSVTLGVGNKTCASRKLNLRLMGSLVRLILCKTLSCTALAILSGKKIFKSASVKPKSKSEIKMQMDLPRKRVNEKLNAHLASTSSRPRPWLSLIRPPSYTSLTCLTSKEQLR